MAFEWVETIRAQKWMKKNIPFLYSWHAYVGHELNLFHEFKQSKSIDEVAESTSVSKELLKSWVEVGVSIRHLKKKSNETYQTRKLKILPKSGSLSGALLKEMMELHIPSLLAYPELMKSQSKLDFNAEKHGDTVAKTSRLIESIAYPKFKKMIKEDKVSSIIDVGCGYAGYLQNIAKDHRKIQMVGIDNHPVVAEKAKENCEAFSNIDIVHADVNEWAPANKENDMVMINNVMHYIEPSIRVDFLSKISQWIHKKGKLIIITPVKNTPYGKEFSAVFNSFFSAHSNLYTLPEQEEFERIAEKLSMKISRFEPIIKEGSWYIAVLEHK